MREVSSLADISVASWTPTSDATRIPEVRHNLRLVVETTKSELEGLAREAKTLEARKKYLREEDARLRKKIKDEADRECTSPVALRGTDPRFSHCASSTNSPSRR